MISADVLGERARLTPDATALVVVEPPLRLTYRELDERAARAALALRALGIAPGDRVALLSHNRVEFLDLFFAAGKGGLRPRAARHAPHGARDRPDPRRQRRARRCSTTATIAALVETLRALPEAAAVERWVALDAAPATAGPSFPGSAPPQEVTSLRAHAARPRGSLLPALHLGHDRHARRA